MEIEKFKEKYNCIITKIETLFEQIDDSTLLEYIEDVRESQSNLKDMLEDNY